MSFDKAIIKRFNEESSCAPPPTKYDPKIPHGAKDIHFGQYSGRREQNKAKDGFVGFVTPAKPSRGRPLVIGSASARSCSDTRLRKGSRSASVSTKSLQEIPLTAVSTDGLATATTTTEQDVAKESDHETVKLQAEVVSLRTEIAASRERMEELKSTYENERIYLTSVNEETAQELADITSKYQLLEEQFNTELLNYQTSKENCTSRIEELEHTIKQLEESSQAEKLQWKTQKEEFDEQRNQTSNSARELLEEERKKHDQVCEILKSEKQQLQAEGEEFRKKLAQTEDIVSELHSQITALQEQLEGSIQTKMKNEQKIRLLETDLENERTNALNMQLGFEAENAQSQKTVESLSDTISTLTIKHNNLIEQHDSVVSELSVFKGKVDQNCTDIQALTVEINEKREQIVRLESTIDELERTKGEEIGTAEKTMADLKTSKDELESKYAELCSEMQVLKTKTEQDTSDIQSLNMDLLNEREKFVKMQSEFDDEKVTLTSQYENMQSKLAEVQSSYKALDQQYQTHRQQYQQMKEESALQIELLEDDRRNHEEMCGILTSEKQRLQSEGEEFRKKLAQTEGLVAELQSQITALQEEIEGFKLAKEESGERIRLLETDLENERTNAVNVLSNFEAERAQSQQTVEGLTGTVSELTTKHSDLIEQYASVVSELSVFKSKVDQNLTDIQALTAEIDEKRELIVRLESTIEEVKRTKEEEIGTAEKTMADLRASKYEVESKYAELCSDIQVLKTKNEQDASEIQSLNMELLNEREKSAKMQSVYNDEKVSLTSQYEDMKRKLALVQSSYKALDQQYQTHRHQCQQMREESALQIEQLESDLRKHEEMCGLLTSEKERLQSEAEELKQKIAQIETFKIQSLIQENMALKENLDQYKSLYGDYADLASHQNNRQKIKHIVNIKEENIKLREENSMLRQKLGEMKEKVRQTSANGTGGRRFDPSQAFKPVLKEPYIRDERDIRGPDARSTFTVPRKTNPKPTVVVESAKKGSKQGMSFNITFSENKENS